MRFGRCQFRLERPSRFRRRFWFGGVVGPAQKATATALQGAATGGRSDLGIREQVVLSRVVQLVDVVQQRVLGLADQLVFVNLRIVVEVVIEVVVGPRGVACRRTFWRRVL
jgi:hypothetical protein